jgi:hypothetical protein
MRLVPLFILFADLLRPLQVPLIHFGQVCLLQLWSECGWCECAASNLVLLSLLDSSFDFVYSILFPFGRSVVDASATFL